MFGSNEGECGTRRFNGMLGEKDDELRSMKKSWVKLW